MSVREILFRGKRVDTGEWVQGAFIPDALETTLGTFGLDGYIKPAGRTREERLMVEVDRDTVGQYTGLTDKNGKRIFEGDIVRYTVDGGESIYTVIWICHRWMVQMQEKYETLPDDLDEQFCADCETIGNIHDNPELLDGGKQWD